MPTVAGIDIVEVNGALVECRRMGWIQREITAGACEGGLRGRDDAQYCSIISPIILRRAGKGVRDEGGFCSGIRKSNTRAGRCAKMINRHVIDGTTNDGAQ